MSTIQGKTTIVVETKVAGAADPVVVSTLTFPDANKENNKVGGYSQTWTAKNAEATEWKIVNFNNNNWSKWTKIACGSKNGASVASIETAAVMKDAITKVSITFGAMKKDKVNSAKLIVATDANFKENVQEIDFTSSLNTGVVDVAVATPTANCYYKLVFDCAQGTANGFVAITALNYYAVPSVTA